MVLERWVESGCFNLECRSLDDCSRSTAILIVLTPNQEGTALMYASVGLIIRWHKGPVGWIEDIPKLIACTLVPNWGKIGPLHQMLVRRIALS